jgi:hypothetical protein
LGRRLHSCGDCPVERDRQDKDKALDAVGMLQLGFGDAEASGFEVGEQALYAPTHSIIKNTAFEWRLRQGDNPRLLVSLLLQNANRRGHAAFVECGIEYCGHIRLGGFTRSDLSALMAQYQIVFEAYAVLPAMRLTPSDQRRCAIEPIRCQQDGQAYRHHGAYRIQQQFLFFEPEIALDFLYLLGHWNRPFAHAHRHHQALKAITDFTLIHHQNHRLAIRSCYRGNLRNKASHHRDRVNQRIA